MNLFSDKFMCMLNGNKENHHDFYKHMLQLKNQQ